MSRGLTRLKRAADSALLKALPFFFHFIKIPYWALIRLIIRHWGKCGLHPIVVGEFAGGSNQTRSQYREEMLLKSMVLFINLKGRSCVDLACNDGFWSFRLARFGLSTVTGIDLNHQSIDRANFLKYVYDFPTFIFRRQDIFEFLRGDGRTYDIVLLLSVIYHLPESSDWTQFFRAISRLNNECLVIDSRWFDNDGYWYDRTSGQALIQSSGKVRRKWRPSRRQVFSLIYDSGYEQILEFNPSGFLSDSDAARGNGDPYTLENVADYITNNRTLLFAYKNRTAIPIDPFAKGFFSGIQVRENTPTF